MSIGTSYSLSQLLASVRRCLEAGFTGRYWIHAETSDLRRSSAGGHVYLELLEKGTSGAIVARVRANIWSSRYDEIARRLAQAGVMPLTSGMSILALVQISFHEQFGLSLVIQDIDPTYSLGEIARLRMETIARLKRDGLFAANRSLPLPNLIQRLAVISSPTAAGYGDFMNHLKHNQYGVICYTALFSAQMQGEQTTPSIIAALERISPHIEHFDAVVIIRGGGAVSDLRAFDCYSLCAACAQYPLPILVGIGHDRDETVLDLIAHTSQKTPTAVADFVVGRLANTLVTLETLGSRLIQATTTLSAGRTYWLGTIASRLPSVAGQALGLVRRRLSERQAQLGLSVRGSIHRHSQALERRVQLLPYLSRTHLGQQRQNITLTRERLKPALRTQQSQRLAKLEQYEQAIRLAHPDHILRRGFALVEHSGQLITDASVLQTNDYIRIRLSSGSLESIVQKIHLQPSN